MRNSLFRTLDILKRLNDAKRLCVSSLAIEYEVSARTIRRDFEVIKEIFEDFLSKDGDCYQAYKKVLLEDVLLSSDLMTLANIVNIFDVVSQKSLISDQTQALIDRSMAVYDFKSRPLENLKNTEVIKTLEHAIKFHKEIKIYYKTERFVSKRNFHPYKILFLNENFYLVGENVSKHSFEFLRISLIKQVIDTKKTFFVKHDIVAFIKQIQTPWATFGNEEIAVRLRVDKSIRRYFLLKKYLPSQEVVANFENGDIEVQYQISNFQEIEELIIKWLPKIRIIAPRSLNKRIKNILKKKYGSM